MYNLSNAHVLIVQSAEPLILVVTEGKLCPFFLLIVWYGAHRSYEIEGLPRISQGSA